MRVQFNAVLKDVTRKGTKIQTDEYLTEGKFPIIDQGNNDIAGYRDDETGLFTDVPAIVFGDHTRIVKYITEPFFLGADGVKVLVPIDRTMNCKYLYYQLLSAKIPDTGYNRHFKWVKELEFQLPSRNEQDDVVKRLDKLCVVISARQQQLAKLDELAKARFVEMFGDESNPFRWPIVDVKDIAYVQVGVVIKPAQYYTDKEHGTRTFRSLNIGPMYVKDADWVYFSEEGNRKNQKSILKENDLLVVRSGAPGTACVVTEEYAGCNAVDVIIAHPDLTKVNPFFLCAYTNLPHGKKQIDEGVGGAAQQHFNVEKYNKMRIILPPLEMQKKYKMFLEQVNKSKLSIKKSLEQVETLKKSLMQKYFG